MKYRTPADLESYAMAPGGSIYGTSSNSAISAFLRSKNRSKVKGLFCSVLGAPLILVVDYRWWELVQRLFLMQLEKL